MPEFIALLRGINVSGQKKIKMAHLKSLFEETGFKNVSTYIQSGNVFFTSAEKISNKIENKITLAIKKKYGFEVPVIVVTSDYIEKILKNNPFIKKKTDIERLYVTFLSEKPSEENINKLGAVNYSPEEYFIDQKIIYLHYPNGFGKARLSNNLFENKLKVTATSRNWKTVNKLFEMTKN